jgi:hypothetical protein
MINFEGIWHLNKGYIPVGQVSLHLSLTNTCEGSLSMPLVALGRYAARNSLVGCYVHIGTPSSLEGRTQLSVQFAEVRPHSGMRNDFVIWSMFWSIPAGIVAATCFFDATNSTSSAMSWSSTGMRSEFDMSNGQSMSW